MEESQVNWELLTVRQCSAAMLTAGVSWIGWTAGRMDWRWGLAAVPVGVAAGWLLLRRVDRQPLFRGPGGWVLAALYSGWAILLMACTLRRAAERIMGTGGSEAHPGWILLLLTLPLLWFGMGKAAAFFRLTEILWLATGLILTVLLLTMPLQVEWRELFSHQGGWQSGVAGMAQILSPGLFLLPYIYRVETSPGALRRGLSWLAVLGGVGAILSGLTIGLLGSALAVQLQTPFFATVGLLGEGARLDGLISALWLLPDVTLAGLLAQSWGRKPRPAIAAGLAFLLALSGITEIFTSEAIGGGTLLLMVLTLIIPSTGEKIVVPFS